MTSLFSREKGERKPAVDDPEHMAMVAREDDQQGVPLKVKVLNDSLEEQASAESRKDKLQGLIRYGTFVQVRESEIGGYPLIFGFRFVDELKKDCDRLKNRSRFVAQNYADEIAASLATRALTLQRLSQRLSPCLASISYHCDSYTRYIAVAYIQSHTSL